MKPEHGEWRDSQIVTKVEYEDFTSTTTGKTYRLASGGVTVTVSERYCETCGDWVKAAGILGALLCPKCFTSWRK